MTNPPASPGHRQPRKQTSGATRHDDGYATAEHLQAQRPQWMIIYGCYSHRYWAYPLFPVTRCIIIHASYPDALIDRLDRAEQAYRAHPPHDHRPSRPGSGSRAAGWSGRHLGI
jgi:hypothetical protein